MSDIQMTVIKPDGSNAAPSEKDQQLLVQVQALLNADPHFQALQNPTLSRAEVNAVQQESEPGYLYLRYSISGKVPQEFWGHWGSRDHVAFKSGQVTVKSVSPLVSGQI
ncbi:hypothetical protein EHF33_14295 [Deinococcus psychrotolerans]|uniref:Uncharacterized protein n=1 Tax=Deinococcus psychrotolerans TaxID=2489213 RepID=A0A3G8YGJ5_9DEIO|nr:hypothetical protein [Deinococcus psychrotolerans]AZI44083.1 hypothetical protein EHF33_14295 [Deinococcus psychrotolerans]